MPRRKPPQFSITPAARRSARRHAFDALKGLALCSRMAGAESDRRDAERSLLAGLARIGQAAEHGTPDERADARETLRRWRAWRG